MLNAYLTCDSYDLPLKKRKRKSDSYAPPGTMLTWIVTRALWYFGGVAHVDYIINPTRIPVHKRGHKKCQNSETKFKIKANTTHQSIRHLYLSLSLSRSLSLSIIRAVQCSAAQRSLRNEETHRLRMGSSDCVLRGAYDRDPSHSSERSLPRFRRYSRILRYCSLF